MSTKKRNFDEPDEDLFAALFGTGWADPENHFVESEELLRRDAVAKTADAEEEARATEFASMMDAADDEAIANDTTEMGSRARLHAGQFHRTATRMYGIEAADMAYEALVCTEHQARLNRGPWRALVSLRDYHPVLYAITIGKIKYGHAPDLGPFGNDYGE